MNYRLVIEKDGEIIFTANVESQERLEEELGRYERHFKPKGEK